ncbi:MAG: hypothetical protein IJ563_10885, partial [Selenomonadaceae bacterium]|nr:hypothetical protein [Selenomonadaceae bacterium]
MSTQVGIIKRLIESLTNTSKTGEEAANEALKTIGITNYQVLLDQYNNDRSIMSGNSIYVQDFLEHKCGVRVNNSDTGAITGSDAGGKTTKTVESIIPETSTAQNLTSTEYNSFTKNGLTVNITYDEPSSVGSAYSYEVDNYIEKQKLVVKNLYNWWIPEALNLINESLGINFTDGRANTNTLEIKFSSKDNPVSYEVTHDLGLASKMTITIGMGYLSALTDSDENGTLSKSVYIEGYYTAGFSFSTKYLDRVLLTALTHLTLEANISYFNNLPFYLRQGLVGIVNGFDDSNIRMANYIIDNSYEDQYLSSYALMRYLAKQTADGKASDTIYIHNKDNTTGNSGDDTWIVTSNTKNATINTGGGNDTIQAFGGDGVVVNGTNSGEVITVSKSSISGSGEVVTIIGGKGNDTLTGSDGADVFSFGSSDDNNIITNFTSGMDSIKITSGSINKSSVKNNDVILTVGSTVVTVKGAKDKPITVTDAKGQTTSQIYGEVEDTTSGGSSNSTISGNTSSLPGGVSYANKNKTLKIKSPFTGTIDLNDYSSAVTKVDASSNSKFVNIKGTSRAELIKASKKAIVIGGGGNDTIYSGKYANTFVYSDGDGDDVIYKFSPKYDTIKIASGQISSASVSGKDVVLTVGSGSITVKNAKGKDMDITDSSGETKTYTFKSGSVINPTKNFEERWFMENDNIFE